MNILLFAMPDTSDILETVCRLPNLTLASLAGSVWEHDVHVLDLVKKKAHQSQNQPAGSRHTEET